MANYKATGKKAKHGVELAQRIRAAVLGAFEVYEKNTGRLISDVLADQLEENPLRFIELASKVMPKERLIEHSGEIHQTVEHRTVSETDQRIEELLSEGKDRDTAKALPH